MDQEEKQLLEENIKLSKENNVILNKIIRNQKINNIYRVVYWSIIIFSSVGAYYFIQPYLNSIVSLYTGGASKNQSISEIKASLSNKQQLENLVKELNGN